MSGISIRDVLERLSNKYGSVLAYTPSTTSARRWGFTFRMFPVNKSRFVRPFVDEERVRVAREREKRRARRDLIVMIMCILAFRKNLFPVFEIRSIRAGAKVFKFVNKCLMKLCWNQVSNGCFTDIYPNIFTLRNTTYLHHVTSLPYCASTATFFCSLHSVSCLSYHFPCSNFSLQFFKD